MTEYIEREAAIAALNKVRDDQRVFKYTTASDFLSARGEIERAAKVLESLPAADVVSVVRCKDCKHHHYCEIHFCDALGMDCPDDSKFFCSYGERKDGDE